MHECAARGCNRKIIAKHLMCRQHWGMVPRALKDAVLWAYRRGQEIDGRVSEGYVDAARDAVEAVAAAEAPTAPGPDHSRCGSCAAPIVWATTATHRPEPLDLEPVATGNVFIDGKGVAVHLGPLELLDWNHEAHPLRLSHFATCPDADDWRKKK